MVQSPGTRRAESKQIQNGIYAAQPIHILYNYSLTSVTQLPCIESTLLKIVSHFRGSLITSDAYVLEDIENRINIGWLKWRSLTGVISDPRMPMEVKGNIFKRAIRPALLLHNFSYAHFNCLQINSKLVVLTSKNVMIDTTLVSNYIFIYL